MTEYEIRPSTLCCARTGRELKPGEFYYSVLSETPEGFTRTDYALEAWTGPPDGIIGFWRSRVSESSSKRRFQPIDDSVIVQFFERLAGEEDSYKQNFRYILALLLMRRKILKLSEVARDAEGETLILRVAATGEEHRVSNPGLTEEQLVAVQAEVEKILQTSVR